MLNRSVTRNLMGGLLATSAIAIAGQASAAAYSDAVLADNPDFYWNMDSLTGGAVDNLGSQGNAGGNQLQNENTGVVFNAGTTNSGGLSLGNTADFTGGADRLFSNAALSGGQFNQYVIEFWVSTSETGAQYLMWHGNGTVGLIHGFGGNGFEAFSGARTGADGPDLAGGGWHHVVIGIDSTAGHAIYVDGALHSNQTETIGSWSGADSIFLGGSNLGDAFNGQIDELAVYQTDTAGLAGLTAQVATHYSAVPEPGSLALLALGGLALIRRRRA